MRPINQVFTSQAVFTIFKKNAGSIFGALGFYNHCVISWASEILRSGAATRPNAFTHIAFTISESCHLGDTVLLYIAFLVYRTHH
jgi:hypothetical protein